MQTKNGIELFELSGVEPNPRHSTVNKGAAICRKENINVVLAAGGGSTIDCAKGIAAAAVTENGDVWPLVSGGVWVMDCNPYKCCNRLRDGRMGCDLKHGYQ